MAGFDDEHSLVGLAQAERILKERYPRFAMSRFALRRACMQGVFPATPVPSGSQVRYKVCVYDVVCMLRAFARGDARRFSQRAAAAAAAVAVHRVA